jgi:hypothetical protein
MFEKWVERGGGITKIVIHQTSKRLFKNSYLILKEGWMINFDSKNLLVSVTIAVRKSLTRPHKENISWLYYFLMCFCQHDHDPGKWNFLPHPLVLSKFWQILLLVVQKKFCEVRQNSKDNGDQRRLSKF